MITVVDGTRRTCSEAIVSVITLYISGKVQTLCLDLTFADVFIGNNVSILHVVPKEAAPLSMIENAGKVDEECGVAQTRSETRKREKAEKPKLGDLKELKTEHDGMWCNREIDRASEK